MSNPFGQPPRPAQLAEHAFYYSGSIKDLSAADGLQGKQLLHVARRELMPNGYHGVASVHLWSKDIAVTESAEANEQLVAEVSWQSGDGGGEEIIVDLTNGSVFTVNATTALNIRAFYRSSVEGVPVVGRATSRVEAAVAWYTSISPKAAKATQPGVAIGAAAQSAAIAIPQQAESMIALSPTSSQYPTLIADFFTSSTAGAGSRYQVTNPFVNGVPIVQGVKFVRFTNGGAGGMVVFPAFELWL